MAESALLKNTLKKLFPAIKHNTLQGKMFFGTTSLDHILFFISLIFLYICQSLQQHVISAFIN